MNIFENAKFGDKFRTRDGRKAIYNYHSIGGYHDIIIDDEGMSYHYADHTNGIINLPVPEKCKIDVDYSSPVDIVSEWKEEINEEELDRLAREEYPLKNGIFTTSNDFMRIAFKKGYRKTKEEKKMDEYIIYCTEEQTKKAAKLGAPIIQSPEWGLDSNMKLKKGKNITLVNPTAEQMIGWLAEQGLCIDVEWSWNGQSTMWVWDNTEKERVYTSYGNSRKEVTLAAIDAALEYLLKAKEE